MHIIAYFAVWKWQVTELRWIYLIQMPKCALKSRLLQLSLPACIFHALCVTAIIHFFSFYGTYNYTHIPEDKLYNELYKETVPTLKKTKQECNYNDILKKKATINAWEVPTNYDKFSAANIANGSYTPTHCDAAISVAILVTYRNRQKQLDIFLPYMHNFLREQNIHYKIFVIEQRDEKPWNKGLLYNVGARRAIAEQFPCLVLHDVDLLPLDAANLYACTRLPRHLSASIDKFRFVLPYPYLVGGVLAIRSDQYIAANGLSNRYEAWGGEDDDFAHRLQQHDLTLLRFPRTQSRYTMLVHRQERKNAERLRLLSAARRTDAHRADGYSSVTYRDMSLTQHRLFTLIAVQL